MKGGKIARVQLEDDDDDDLQPCQTRILDDDPDVIKPRFVEDDGASSDPIEDVD